MTIRTGPTEPRPTHHVKLTDRDGNSVGLILCNDKGEPAPMYNKQSIDRTALKTTSGGGGYADFNSPYSPIVQDDWSGGRGNLNFEADSTRYYDGKRVVTRHSNKAILGPQEHLTHGYKAMCYKQVNRYHKYITESESLNATYGYRVGKIGTNTGVYHTETMTIAKVWLRVRKTGSPGNITISFLEERVFPYTLIAQATITAASVTDSLGDWYALAFAYGFTAGFNQIGIYADLSGNTAMDYWEFGLAPSLKTTILSSEGEVIAEGATADDTCIYYEYKGQQYKVLSTAGAAPTVWMNGDRGAADSNAGQLTKLIDATKTWTVNAWAGCIVKIVQGTGKAESIQYRTISSNTATQLTVSSAWTIQHDTTTEYVILASDTWRELTGHGLTVPVTSVLPVGDVVYFAQGDSVLMRTHREYNNAGTWTESDWRAEGVATNFATYLAYQPLANKIWRGQNSDATGIVSVSSATPTAYATDLTFAAVISIGYKYEFINGLEVYPNDSGTEALWVYKEELAYSVTTTATGIKLDEMRHLRSRDNGKANLVHNVYSYFSLGNGLQRYYGGSIDSVGPNLDEGLPADRQGKIVQLLGYPGRVMAIIDGGASGYSSLLERSGSGWHEVYRAPLGEKLKAMALQVIPGTTIDRLWLYQGNISIWLPIASSGVDELNDSAYTYTCEGAIILSRMHSGMFDVQKLIRLIKIWADQLAWSEDDSTARIQINLDYRLDDDTAWTAITGTLIQSPMSTLDMVSVFGLAGKRIQLRIRLQSDDNTQTPILKAAIVEAVIRINVKYMYNLTFRVMDDEPTLTPREMDEDSITAAGMSAMTKLAQIESWADADADSLIYMTSNSPLYNGKYVFINPPVTRQIALDPDSSKQWTGNAFICSTTAQEA